MMYNNKNYQYSVIQNGQKIASENKLEVAVATAKNLAVNTGTSVSLIAETEAGESCEVVFNPDGTNENIWCIDKGHSFVPAVGGIYTNRGGGVFRCIGVSPNQNGPMYYNGAGGSSNSAAEFRNVESGWTFTAKGIIQYIDGTIEWDHSTNGRFVIM